MNPKPKDGGKATYTHVRCVAWDLDVDLEDGQEVIVHGDFFSKTYEAKDGTKKPDFGLNVKALGWFRRVGPSYTRHPLPIRLALRKTSRKICRFDSPYPDGPGSQG
jgi:hypothetical protein